MRPLRRCAVALGVTWLVLFAAARPASAHATLQETSPGPDVVLAEPPTAVSLRFDEPVDPGLGGVEVIDPDGERADRGRAERAEGGLAVRAPIDAQAEGSYTVAWSVLSADGHVISGSFVFSVGEVSEPVAGSDSDRSAMRTAAGLGRWAAFAGALLLAGSLAFERLVSVDRLEPTRTHRLRWLAVAGAAAALVGTSAVLVLQVALASDRGLLASLELVGDAVANTRFGTMTAWRISFALAAVAVAAARVARPARWTWTGAALVAAGLLVLPALGGHAWTASPRGVAVVSDVVHQGAAAVWVGGLVALVATAPGSGQAMLLTRRFSVVALVAVVVVAATGLVSGLVEVDSVEALTDTTYGRLLVLKVLGVAVLVGLGWLNRRLLMRRLAERGTLFRVVGIEIGIAALVLALTAALVDQPPARDTVAEPFTAVVGLVDQPATGSVQVEVYPAGTGTNDIHLYFLDDAGLPRAVDAVEIEVGRPGVPDRRLEVTPVTADHALALGALFPTAATWTVTVTTARDGEVSTTAVQVPIR